MGSYCSCGCCTGVSAKNAMDEKKRKRPFKRSSKMQDSFTGTLNHTDNDQSPFVFWNQTSQLQGTMSTDTYSTGIHNTDYNNLNSKINQCYAYLDSDDQSAMSQFLIKVTENLSMTLPDDENAVTIINLPAQSALNLNREFEQMTRQSRPSCYPTLRSILKQPCSSDRSLSISLVVTYKELKLLETEIFRLLTRDEAEPDPSISLRSCLLSRRIRPPTNRIMLLNLRSLLKNPKIAKNSELTKNTTELIDRLEAYPQGLELTPLDSGLLLEIISTINVPIFDPTYTPPVIFNLRDTPLIKAAIQISELAMILRELAESQNLCSQLHLDLLKKAESYFRESDLTSSPSKNFFSKLISIEDRINLTRVIDELQEKSTGLTSFQPTGHLEQQLSVLSKRFGTISLLCAKCRIARALYTIKNHFRLLHNTSKRICTFEDKDYELIHDALKFVVSSPVVLWQEVSKLQGVLNCIEEASLNGTSSIEVRAEDATYLQHVLTLALDYQPTDKKLTSGIHSLVTPSETQKQLNQIPSSIEKEYSNPNTCGETRTPSLLAVDGDLEEEFVVPVDASVVRNPFISPTSLDTDDVKEDIFADFFDRKSNKTEPILFDFPPLGRSDDAFIYENRTGVFESISSIGNTSRDDAHYKISHDSNMFFNLLVDALLLKDVLMVLQRYSNRIFACKLASFQIMQLCDSVRKLTSVDPRADDSKLIKNLSTYANRHLPVRLKLKTMSRLRNFSNRVHSAVVESSINKVMTVINEIKSKTPTHIHSIAINSESAFDLVSVCLAALFDSVDTFSIFFLEKIRSRSFATSERSFFISNAEEQNLSRLANQALMTLLHPNEMPLLGFSAQLLNLYKLKALAQAPDTQLFNNMHVKTVWCHALRQFFINNPHKASKKVFYSVAFYVFISENVNWPEDLRLTFLNEINALIAIRESSLSEVRHMFDGKTKLNLELLKSNFYMNIVNNINLDRDPVLVGKCIFNIAAKKSPSEIFQDELKKIVRVFFQPPSPTQERHGYRPELDSELAYLRESLLSVSEDQSLVAVRRSHLIKLTASLADSPMDTSPRNSLIQVLLLEVLNLSGIEQPIYLDRIILADLFHISATIRFEPVQMLDAVDEVVNLQSATKYLQDVISNEKIYASSDQLIVAAQLLGNLQLSTTNSDEQDFTEQIKRIYLLKVNQMNFSQRIDSFITSDNCLVFTIASLRSLRSRLAKHKLNIPDACELIFALSVSRNHIHSSDSLFQECLKLEKVTRNALLHNSIEETDLELLNMLHATLEKRLASKFALAVSQTISYIGQTHDETDILNILQFIALAGVLLPNSLEIKLLSIIPCYSLSARDPIINEVLQKLTNCLYMSSNQTNYCQLRLITLLFPDDIDVIDSEYNVEFEKLVRTLSNACCLADKLGNTASTKIYHLLAKVMWSIYFDNQRLTIRGTFGQFYAEVSRYRTVWLEKVSTQSKSTNDAFFNKVFFLAPRLPLDETSKLTHLENKSSGAVNSLDLNAFPSNSFFPLLQALQIYEALFLHTNSKLKLTTSQLMLIYHSLIICLSSGYLQNSIGGKVGIAFRLNEIEKALRASQSLIVDWLSLADSYPCLQNFFTESVITAKNVVFENLRSRIAPVVLSVDSESGDSFTLPDMTLVEEALQIILSGAFVLPVSEARDAIKLLARLQQSTHMSSKELTQIYSLINHLFTATNDRFSNSPPFSSYLEQVPRTFKAACGMLEQRFKILCKTQEVEAFFKALTLLSKGVRSAQLCITPDISTETLVSSPTDSFASFSNLSNINSVASNADLSIQSLYSIGKTDAVVLSTSPHSIVISEENMPLWNSIHINEESIILMLEGYHYAQLTLNGYRQDENLIDRLKYTISKLFIGSQNAKLKIGLVEEFSVKALDFLKKHLIDVIIEKAKSRNDQELESLLHLIQGYLSLALTVDQDIAKTATEFFRLRIKWTQGNLSMTDVRQFVNFRLPFEARSQLSVEKTADLALKALCLQAALKASENHPLTMSEKISFGYWQAHEKNRFAELYAAIFWDKIWPDELISFNAELVFNTINDLRKDLSEETKLSVWVGDSLNARCLCAALASWNLCQPYPIKFDNGLCGSTMTLLLARTLQSLPDCSNSSTNSPSEAARFIRSLIAMKCFDSFIRLSPYEALELAENVNYIANHTNWFASLENVVIEMRQRLYLGITCHLSTTEEGDSSNNCLEFSASYLHSNALLSALSPQGKEAITSVETDSLCLQPFQVGMETDFQLNASSFPRRILFTSQNLKSSQSCFFPYYFANGVSGSRKWRGYHGILRSLPICIEKAGISQSSPSMSSSKTSLDRLHELIETRRAIVAGSMSELNYLGFGYPEKKLLKKSALPKWPTPGPRWGNNGSSTSIGFDLNSLRRRLALNTATLLKRSVYEERESEICFKTVDLNLQRLNRLVDEKKL